MIFVGNADRGYFVEEYCKKHDMDFGYVEAYANIEAQVNPILSYQKQDYTVFDVEQYTDEAEVITEWVWKICNTNCSKPIILASGYKTYARIITELAKSGVKYFILGAVLSEMKDQLEKCLNGFYDANGIEFIEDLQKATEEVEEHVSENCTTIAVAGACSRIGTTTNAIQFIRYIQLCGKRACYIQMNSNDYIQSMKTWFNVEEDEEIGRVTYQGIDHYYKLDKIREIMQKNYDFYVYDYGVYFDTDFNRVSFQEKDKQVFVVGSDQSEMQYTYNIIQSAFYEMVNYIFSFTSDADKKDILEMMDEKAEKTYFATYVPDKYVFAPNDIYSAIVPIDEEVPQKEEKKKKGFFKRR